MHKVTFALLVIAALVFGACAPVASPGGAAQPAGETAQPAGEATTCEGPLKFWTFEYAPNVVTLLNDYVDQWNQTHDVKVEYQSFPWAQYTGEILTTGIATGEAPDVFFISPGDWRRYAEGGLALPLDDFFPEYLKTDLLPASLDAVTLNGHIYSIPFEMEPVVLWYNKAMFDEAGVQPPKSWEELIATAQKLTTEDRFGILIPTNPDYYQNFVWYPFLWMAGGDVVDKGFTKATIDSPAGAQALQLWGDLVNKYKVAASTSTGNDPTDERFPTGRAAMFVSGYWVYGWIQASYPDFVKDLGVALIPPPNAGDANKTVYGGWTTMVYGKTKCPKEAAEFALGLFGAPELDRNIQWSTVLNTKLSPRASLKEAAADFYKTFPHDFFVNEVFPVSQPEPAYPPEIARAVWEGLQDTMFNGVSGEDAAKAMADKINAYLETR